MNVPKFTCCAPHISSLDDLSIISSNNLPSKPFGLQATATLASLAAHGPEGTLAKASLASLAAHGPEGTLAMICKHFKRGDCRFGNRCHQRHEGPPARVGGDSDICRHFQIGDCHFGDRCRYSHGEPRKRKIPNLAASTYSSGDEDGENPSEGPSGSAGGDSGQT